MPEESVREDLFITGLGMISCLGNSARAGFQRMCESFREAEPLSVIDPAPYRLTRAYEISDPWPAREGCKGRAGETLRATTWLVEAISQAIANAGLEHARDLPVIVGTGLREFQSFERWCAEAQPFHPVDLHFEAAIRARIPQAGDVITLCNACSASSFALGLALDTMTVEGQAAAIVAGCDAIAASMFTFTDRAGQSGLTRVEPFDRRRRGVILGEGSAAVVLETGRHIGARSEKTLARLCAVGMSCDAGHETAPDPAGIATALRDAIARSGRTPKDIDLIVAHATGTALNDPAEASAIGAVFGEHRPKTTAIKGHTGHTSGAAGLMSVIVAILAMGTGRIPPISPAIDKIDEAACLDLVTSAALVAEPRCALVNAFGFGGVNAVTVLEKVGR
jgi:3-oxoacyl-[acyl-carrier-protein] synthase II